MSVCNGGSDVNVYRFDQVLLVYTKHDRGYFNSNKAVITVKGNQANRRLARAVGPLKHLIVQGTAVYVSSAVLYHYW